MLRIKIVVVLYKISPLECSTISSLIDCFTSENLTNYFFDIVLWDNSPLSCSENTLNALKALFTENVEFDYIHTPENLPLSKIYNNIIDSSLLDSDYLILLDQDSRFGSDYICEACSIMSKKKYHLILPLIYHRFTLVSPNKYYFLKGFYFSSPPAGEIQSKQLNAINSGMIIAIEYLKSTAFRYDERLKNYCTDDYFMKMYRQNRASVYILKSGFNHDLSLSTLNENSSKLKERYKLMIEGREIVYSNNIFELMIIKLY
ncbi:TPA: glycosyltransferase, partial [Cronobacter sakazakii]|nr:glycosyltransferase [Cronobacter sakazakii]HAU5494453.1 glycosyltransferase [Cronobacter sakazakii]